MTSDVFHNKQKFFDRWAPHYDCLFTTIFYQAVHQRMLEYVNLPHQPHILDLGCGTGRLLHRLATQFATLQGTGLDLSTQMLRQAQQRNQHGNRLTYRQGNAESMPFAEGEFDAVFNTISFLHYPNPQQVVSEVHRVLHPGGRFYLADNTVREEIGDRLFGFSPGGIRCYSPPRREQLGAAAGFECLGHYYLLGPVLLTIFSKPI